MISEMKKYHALLTMRRLYVYMLALRYCQLMSLTLLDAVSSTPGWSRNNNSKGKGIPNALENQKEFYSYDPVGNRLTADHNRAYSYNQANQLVSENGISYTYDKNGNLISKVEFKYDPFGRRIEKAVSGARTRYFYDNEDILFEYDGAGVVGNKYIHGQGIDEPLALLNNKDVYYYHADGLGSITALTDSSAKVVQTYEYDSFGNLKDQKNRIKQPYTFTAREWDVEIGLYYYRARYYDAKAGRFISFDPILHPANNPPRKTYDKRLDIFSLNTDLLSPPQTNPYIYGVNNPINYTDPTGLVGCGPFGMNIPDPYGFGQCCDAHDKCYEDCRGRAECDRTFCSCVKNKCSLLARKDRDACNCRARIYCNAVTNGGWIVYYPSCGSFQ